jgi:transposase
MQYEFLTLVPVNPKQLARFREALGCSGAKDDPGDAELLAELLAKHEQCLKVWKPDTQETRLLASLNEDRRNLVNQRRDLTSRLRSQLKQYFPQALQLLGTLHSSLACATLECWPSLPDLQQASELDLREIWEKHGRLSVKQRDKWLQIIDDAIPLTTDQAILESRKLLVVTVIRQIVVLNQAIEEYDKRIAVLFAEHEDRDIFDSFPGAGPAMAPRLLAAFGTDRERFSAAGAVQSLSGIAPVTKQSGKSKIVHRRWACNKYLLQTFHEHAAHSLRYSRWAKAYYNMMKKEKNCAHHAAVRALAFKWIRVLYRCWKNRELYDESKYLEVLTKRNSPIIAHLEPGDD